MKRIITVFFVAALMFLTMSSAWADEYISKDVLISEYGLEDNGYLDEFIQKYGVTEEHLKEFNVKRLFENYLFVKEAKEYDRWYMLDAERNADPKSFEAGNIARMFWLWNTCSFIQEWLYEPEEMKLYCEDGNFLADIRNVVSRDIAAEKLDNIVSKLNEYGVPSWEECCISNAGSDEDEHYFYWRFVVEMKDGTFFVSYGNASENLPQNFAETVKLLEVA